MPDARAAARIIDKLNMLFPAIQLDAEPLLEEAERIEEQIKTMLKHHLSSKNDEGEEGSSTMHYV